MSYRNFRDVKILKPGQATTVDLISDNDWFEQTHRTGHHVNTVLVYDLRQALDLFESLKSSIKRYIIENQDEHGNLYEYNLEEPDDDKINRLLEARASEIQND